MVVPAVNSGNSLSVELKNTPYMRADAMAKPRNRANFDLVHIFISSGFLLLLCILAKCAPVCRAEPAISGPNLLG